jgi:hypothetical protein
MPGAVRSSSAAKANGSIIEPRTSSHKPERDITMSIKPNTVAVAAIVAALATPGVTILAFARDNQTPTWEACFNLAVERGSGPLVGPGDKVMSQYNRFMGECLAGKIPLNTDVNASVAKSPARAHASRQ